MKRFSEFLGKIFGLTPIIAIGAILLAFISITFYFLVGPIVRPILIFALVIEGFILFAALIITVLFPIQRAYWDSRKDSDVEMPNFY